MKIIRPSNLSKLLVLVFTYALVTANVQADTLLEFDFENFSHSQIVGPHSAAVPGIIGVHNMSNNGVENFSLPNSKLSMTRSAGAVNYPELTFITTQRMTIASIEFTHIHNHNYVETFSYDVDVQLDSGYGYSSIGTFKADRFAYTTEMFSGPGLLFPGTYKNAGYL